MSILQALSQGLRAAGATGSQSVYNTQRQEEQTDLDRKQRMKELTLGVIVKGLESGAIAREKGPGLFQQLGVDMPGMGPTADTQMNQLKLAEAQDLTNRRNQFNQPETPPVDAPLQEGALPPTEVKAQQTPLDVYMARAQRADGLGLKEEFERNSKLAEMELRQREKKSGVGTLIAERDALPEGDPRRAIYDKAIGKETTAPEGAGTQQERALQALRNLQIKVNGGGQLSEDEEFQAQSARAILSQQRMGIDPVTNQPMFSQPLTVPESMSVGRSGGSGKAVNTVPPITSGRKPLDPGTEKKLGMMGEGVSQLNSLVSRFKDEFAGFVSDTLGAGAIESGRRGILPKYKDTADFWQAYEQWITDVRAEKFGLSLTGNELKAMGQYKSKPSDSAAVIKTNMARQLKIVEDSIQRQLGAVAVSGQNVKQAEALLPKPETKEKVKAKPPGTYGNEQEIRDQFMLGNMTPEQYEEELYQFYMRQK